MKTDELIQQLVGDAKQKARFSVFQKLLIGITSVIAITLLQLWIFLGIHPEFQIFLHTPVFWFRFILLALICVLAMHMMWKLSQPFTQPKTLRVEAGVSFAALFAILTTPFIPNLPSESMVIAQAHGWALASVELGEDVSIWKILLHTSGTITLLALPVFAALIWLMKRMAPSHPSLAGASAGFAASAMAALEYSFNSPYDLSAYSNLGYFICMASLPAIGALIGKRWLRW
jgi:hypothetical protein